LEQWIGEENSRLGVALKFHLKKIVHEESSEYFDIIIAETQSIGKILLFREDDDITIQTAEKFDFYDEMIAHVPLTAHPNPRRILIIGGGDGVVLREVLKYDSVKKVIIVEIDKSVIETSKKYLRLDEGAFDDPRVEIVIEDAAQYLRKADFKFDVIIGDYSDPYQDTAAGSLISKEFYRNVKKVMRPDSIAVFQAGSPLFQREIFLRIYGYLKQLFRIVKPFWTIVPYYPGGMWIFLTASDRRDASEPLRQPPTNTIFYNTEVHKCAFVLPEIIRKLVEQGDSDGA